MQVTDQVYVYLWRDSRENNCNSIFIDGKVPLLIDPGRLLFMETLFDRMAGDGLDAKRVKVVICTHGHPDHFEGVGVFVKLGAKIGTSKEEETYINTSGPAWYRGQGQKMPEFRVDFHLKEGTLHLGRHEFEVLSTPGHSPGSLCISWPRQSLFVSGDAIFDRGVGRADLPGGNAKDLRATVERLSRLSFDLLIPGHGATVQGRDAVRENFRYIRRLIP